MPAVSVLLSALLLAPGGWSPAAAGEPLDGQIRYYWSAVDGSRQAYGVYLPRANPPSDSGFPVVMHGHGYGWSVSPRFSAWQRQWADDHGWVLVNVNGRGPNFYDGIGDDDVMRVLEDVAGLTAVDRSRVFITGGSMGGTGAYRMGVRRPDTFSAAAPVDGWTDFRLFHKHWYERKDMPDSIEEFRRPLLEATSPLYLAGTARWTDIQLITDAKDTVVWPSNGLRLTHALHYEAVESRDQYRHELVYNPDRGHGGGYDLPRIYARFLDVAGPQRPPSVTIQTTLLRYGEVHWARVERFHIQGGMGRLDAEVAETAVHVRTANLDGFGLRLPDTPLADRDRLQVIADGIPCYDGPPADISFAVLRDEIDRVVGWTPADPPGTMPTKQHGLEGPIGEAFLTPFAVLWGSAGDLTAVRAAKAEAEDFAREWNAFNVHYEAVVAKPEDELTTSELEGKNLIVFGTLDDSSILRRVDDATDLPVKVFADRVVVHDPVYGDRAYGGGKYGAYWIYPSPLSDFTTFVVGCKGRFATMADGSGRRGLGYDLEKLPWGWPDYVVFDSDTDDLPYCENVNNKPTVLAYEAAYFVEAGFFDQDWKPDRDIEARRIRAARPPGSRLVHVDSIEAAFANPPMPSGASVRVVDEQGRPVPHARVTLAWTGAAEHTSSRPTDTEGAAFFPAPEGVAGTMALRAEVVNVCATAATYSPGDDRQREVALVPGDAHEIALDIFPPNIVTEEQGWASFTARLSNNGGRPVEVVVSAPGDPGEISPLTQELAIGPGKTGEAQFAWDPGSLPAGDYSLTLTACTAGPGQRVVRTADARLSVTPVVRIVAKVLKVAAADRAVGQGYEIVAEIWNAEAQPVSITAACTIVEARRHLPTQTLHLGPDAKAAVRWRSGPETPPLASGVYTARVALLDIPGAVGEAWFVVK